MPEVEVVEQDQPLFQALLVVQVVEVQMIVELEEQVTHLL